MCSLECKGEFFTLKIQNNLDFIYYKVVQYGTGNYIT